MIKLGKAFADNVEKYQKKRAGSGQKLTGWGIRITFLYLLLLAGFFVLGIRLFHLTIVQGKENRELSEENRIRTAIIHAPRGNFLDRRGVKLTRDIPSFRVIHLCKKEELCPGEFVTEEEWKKRPFTDNVILEKDYLRQYVYPKEMVHVLGYLTQISAEEVTNPLYTYQGYLSDDRIGRTGLEERLEKDLRGVDGKELLETDARGQKKRTLGKIDPLPGENITLSIDSDIQQVAYDALEDKTGAIIVSKPKTGEILALVSNPGFDPNLLHQGLTPAEFTKLTQSPDRPLFNRAVSGVYPPGSTFKIVAAVSGLESGKITPQTVFNDTGILRVGEFSFSNWYFTQYGKTEGAVDIVKAMARSNDIFFYELGAKVGVTTIADWGKKFGIGKKTGIEIPGEAEGVMPDPEWREKVRNEKWYLGDTYHLAIGQGDLQTSPLQVNQWASVIANGGKLCKPTLLKSSVVSLPAQAGRESSDKNCKDLGIKKETITLVIEGMVRACERGTESTYQGTGWPLFDFTVTKETLTGDGGEGKKYRVPVACKTGTAEIGLPAQTGDPENNTHAWFTAFAPIRSIDSGNQHIKSDQNDQDLIIGEPEISVTVLVEKGGEGSTVAAPIAKKILEEWFKR